MPVYNISFLPSAAASSFGYKRVEPRAVRRQNTKQCRISNNDIRNIIYISLSMIGYAKHTPAKSRNLSRLRIPARYLTNIKCHAAIARAYSHGHWPKPALNRAEQSIRRRSLRRGSWPGSYPSVRRRNATPSAAPPDATCRRSPACRDAACDLLTRRHAWRFALRLRARARLVARSATAPRRVGSARCGPGPSARGWSRSSRPPAEARAAVAPTVVSRSQRECLPAAHARSLPRTRYIGQTHEAAQWRSGAG